MIIFHPACVWELCLCLCLKISTKSPTNQKTGMNEALILNPGGLLHWSPCAAAERIALHSVGQNDDGL